MAGVGLGRGRGGGGGLGGGLGVFLREGHGGEGQQDGENESAHRVGSSSLAGNTRATGKGEPPRCHPERRRRRGIPCNLSQVAPSARGPSPSARLRMTLATG